MQLQNISLRSRTVSLAPDDCSDEKLELVCSRAPICRDAMEAKNTLQVSPSTDQTAMWIDQHIEGDDGVKRFTCKSSGVGRSCSYNI